MAALLATAYPTANPAVVQKIERCCGELAAHGSRYIQEHAGYLRNRANEYFRARTSHEKADQLLQKMRGELSGIRAENEQLMKEST